MARMKMLGCLRVGSLVSALRDGKEVSDFQALTRSRPKAEVIVLTVVRACIESEQRLAVPLCSTASCIRPISELFDSIVSNV
jgi:hypothetical protein